MEEVERLRGRGPFIPDCTIAKAGADKLWKLVTQGDDTYVNALGCLTGKILRKPLNNQTFYLLIFRLFSVA